MSKFKTNYLKKLIAIVIFGIAFGFVEAAVVYYLRHLLNFKYNYNVRSYRMILNLGFISFIKPLHPVLLNNAITKVEFVRESATIVMLITLSYLAASNFKKRVAAFLISFACWDIFYYVFLKILTGWPSGLNTKDIYFLIPVVWVGPVITPLIISTILLISGVIIFLRKDNISKIKKETKLSI